MKHINIISLLFCILLNFGCAKKNYSDLSEKPKVKNIIFLIGDGMGLSQVSTAFFYNTGTPNFKRFKSIGLINTSSATDLITDSAAGATAFSTGVKTYNSSIGMNADTLPQKTIVEKLSKTRMKVGIIVTSSITHATPASFYAHVKSRELQDEIATWLPKSELDYFAAGGLNFFSKRDDSIDYVEKLKKAGFIIETESINLNNPLLDNKRYGFLLAEDGMPKLSDGRGDFLANATAQAISHLSKGDKGFFNG